MRGERGRAAGAGHVRRLPVPLLPRRPVGPAPRPRAARRPPRLRLPPPADPRAPPAGAAGRRGERGGGRPGQLLGVPRRALRGPAEALAGDDARGRRATSASTPSGWRRRSTPAPTATRIERDVASAAASGATGTPTFFVNGKRHFGAYDASSLVEALEAERQSTAMRALVQRVSQAAVDVEGERVAQIGPGMLVLLGVGVGDGAERGRPARRQGAGAADLRRRRGADERAARRARGPLRQPVHPLRRRPQGQPAQLRRGRPAGGGRAAV